MKNEQAAHGNNIAQANRGGHASVVVFQEAPPAPVDEIPPVADLSPGSRVSFGVNPLFIGREDELGRLARLVKEGGTAAVGQIAAGGFLLSMKH